MNIEVTLIESYIDLKDSDLLGLTPGLTFLPNFHGEPGITPTDLARLRPFLLQFCIALDTRGYSLHSQTQTSNKFLPRTTLSSKQRSSQHCQLFLQICFCCSNAIRYFTLKAGIVPRCVIVRKIGVFTWSKELDVYHGWQNKSYWGASRDQRVSTSIHSC